MDSKKRHIVYITREYPPSIRSGGIATYVETMANILANEGWKVTIITASDNTKEESETTIDNIKIIRLSGGDFYIPSKEPSRCNLFKSKRYIYRFISYRYKLRKTIIKLKDISLIEAPEYGAESLLLDNLGIPLIIKLHTPLLLNREKGKLDSINIRNLPYYLLGYCELLQVKKARHIISCSEHLKSIFIDSLEIKKEKITTIHNAIINKPIKPQLNIIKNNIYTILFVGNFTKEKGVFDLIEAIIKVKENIKKEIFLLMAGKQNTFFNEYLKEKNLDKCNWIINLNYITNKKLIYEYYKSSNICCFPSWWENSSYTCLEAMSVGGLVVASGNSGNEEIIEDNISGFLFPPKNIDQLANTLKKVYELNPKQQKEIRTKAIENIRSNFSNNLIEKNIEYYKNIISS